MPRSPDRIAAMLAAWRLGAAYLPLDLAWPEARLASLIAAAGCAALVASAPTGARIGGGASLVTPEAQPAASVCPLADVAPDALAYAIYTSGSTGAPKAVEVTQANLAALMCWHCEAFAVGPGTRCSHIAGLAFDAAGWEIWPVLAAGGTLVLIDEATRLDPPRLRDWLVAERVEVAFAPTALAEPLLTLAWPRDGALRLLLTGGDQLTRRPPAGLPFRLVNNYGPTESTVVATSGVVSPEGEGLPSIGAPIAGTHIHLLDAGGALVSPGEEGEICIGGAQIAAGYRGDPELTAVRFIDHLQFGRLYRSGDLGVWRADGELDFRGRVDAQIKLRGQRIEPGEIVAALDQLPGVAASAVALHEGQLTAWVVPAAGIVPTAGALRAMLAARLPDALVPARFATIAALPLTANGKLDLAALPEPSTGAMVEAPPRRGPANPVETRLLAIVSDVIGNDDIGVEDDFFLLGGHSLLATQVVIRARDAFGVDLTLFHLFEARTVTSLAQLVEGLVLARLDALSDEDIRRLAAG